MAWAARCNCRNDHNSASGRCNARDIVDPTATRPEDAVYCESCRQRCPRPKMAVAARHERDGGPFPIAKD